MQRECLSDVGNGRRRIVSGGKPESGVEEACEACDVDTNAVYDAAGTNARRISRMCQKESWIGGLVKMFCLRGIILKCSVVAAGV